MSDVQATRPSGVEGGSGPDAVPRALADPQRRQMLQLVRRHELAAGQIATHFAITQQAVSQHLRVLLRAGLLSERREGARRLLCAPPGGPRTGAHRPRDLWPDALLRLKQAVGQGKRRQKEGRITR